MVSMLIPKYAAKKRGLAEELARKALGKTPKSVAIAIPAAMAGASVPLLANATLDFFNRTFGLRHHLVESRKKNQIDTQIDLMRKMVEGQKKGFRENGPAAITPNNTRQDAYFTPKKRVIFSGSDLL